MYWQEPNHVSTTLYASIDPALGDIGPTHYSFTSSGVLTNSFGYWNNVQGAFNPYLYDCTYTGCVDAVHFYSGDIGTVNWAETNVGNYGSVQYANGQYYAILNSVTTTFNTEVSWNSSLQYDTLKADGRKVATHEIGHVEGLGHTGYTAIMHQGAENVYTPQANDINVCRPSTRATFRYRMPMTHAYLKDVMPPTTSPSRSNDALRQISDRSRRSQMVWKAFPKNILKLVSGLLTTVAMLGMFSACSSDGGRPGSGSTGQQSASGGLHIQLHADKFEFTSPAQFCQSLFTAEVVVGSHGTASWNTPDGKLPAGVTTYADIVKKNLRVYTPVTFTRLVPLVDHRHMATKGYVTIGGNVGKDSYTIDEDPSLAGIGGHYIVALYPSTPQTGGNTEEVLVVGNAYPVDAQGRVILQQATNPNEPGPGQPQPAITVSLTSLEQQLASCK